MLETSGESVMNTAMAAYLLPAFSDALELAASVAGMPCSTTASSQLCTQAAAVRNWTASLVVNLNKFGLNHGAEGQAGGSFYRRAFLGNDELGWLGCDGSCPPGPYANDSAIWLEPNAWALLARAPDAISALDNAASQAPSIPAPPGVSPLSGRIVSEMVASLQMPSAVGSVFANQTYHDWGGAGHYSNTWFCAIMPWLQALGELGYGDVAYAEFVRNTFAHHADVYPDVLSGTWSGSDNVRTPANPPAGNGGVEDWALHNMWSHATMQLGLPSILGVVFSSDELRLSYRLYDQEQFALSSKLLEASRAVTDGVTVLAGRWSPWQQGPCPSVSLLLRDDEPDRIDVVALNGVATSAWSLQGSARRLVVSCAAWDADQGLFWSVKLKPV